MMHNKEAEMSCIGAALLDPGAAEVLAAMLKPDDFWSPAHKLIWAAGEPQFEASAGVDPVTLSQALTERGTLQDAGGVAYLVACMEYVVSPANCEYYGRIVRDLATARRVISHAKKLIEVGSEGDPAKVIELSKVLPEVAADSDELYDWSDIDATRTERGISTGFHELDILTGCGYVCGQTTFIGAETKGGKTTWMIGSMLRAAKRGVPVAYATFADLSAEQLKRRSIKQQCGIGGPSPIPDRNETYRWNLDQMDVSLRGLIRVYEARQHGRDVDTFIAKLRAAHRKAPVKAVFVDYVQKIGVRDSMRLTKVQQMEYVSDRLKALAEDLNIPVIVGTQLTKIRSGNEVETTTKYASALEQDAGLVIKIERSADTDQVIVLVDLNRFGPQNVAIDMRWDSQKVAINEKM